MINLTKGQKLFNNPGMVVYDPTGFYEDGDPVICATADSPEEPVCRYEAKFIAYGDQVYNIADEEKLMEEVQKIDPESLLGKNKEEVAVDQMVEQVKMAETQTPPIEEIVSQEPVIEQPPIEQPIVETPAVSTPEPVIEPVTEVVNTTPETVIETPPVEQSTPSPDAMLTDH